LKVNLPRHVIANVAQSLLISSVMAGLTRHLLRLDEFAGQARNDRRIFCCNKSPL